MQTDTIAAIATALGEASIAVIRVSGEQAISRVDQIFSGKISLLQMATHTVQYGHIVSLASRDVIDEVLVTVMKAPRTYTTEDVVEISTHGGIVTVQSVLSEILRTGVRLAEPGEFTKWAFLGGRIDLAQAEGVMELIRAQTDSARTAALLQVEGSLTRSIRILRQSLLEVLAHIEVTLDYPEHDEEKSTTLLVADRIRSFRQELAKLLDTARTGKVLREGLRTVIVGKPNVGKSSLLNQLAQMDRAIVTDLPGTTRDIIEEVLQFGGIALRLADTAGLRETNDPVEQIGVMRSKEALATAELLLVVLDASVDFTVGDQDLLDATKGLPRIILLNKMDLPARITVAEITALVDQDPVIAYSTALDFGKEDLEKAILELIFSGGLKPTDATFLANVRHVALFEEADRIMERVLYAAESGVTLDFIAADVLQSWAVLGEVIGETPGEDLLDQIFRQFCLGK